MKRTIMNKLVKWKNSPYRKPLVLLGVRQVGKTWLLRELGTNEYENTAYFNFDLQPELAQFFETTKQPERILENLAAATGERIIPEKTLIVFDEIQEFPNVLNSLKYFCETAPQYHVAAAGSLLGIALAAPSAFPVGKVHFETVEPMTFSEYLLARGDGQLSKWTKDLSRIEPVPEAILNPLEERLKLYFISGGMPEPMRRWIESRSIEGVEEALMDILRSYERDFSKHPNPTTFPKISLIWDSLPSQLARENKKFFYQTVKKGARAREYEDALRWLVDAHLIYKVYRCNSPHLPMSAYDDLSAFKVYQNDVGILRRHAFLAPTAVREGNRLFTEFKGALSENYILQSLSSQFEVPLRYWKQDNPPYEVDFLLQRENLILPIEVKAGKNVRSNSLKKYQEFFGKTTPLRLRYSLENLSLDGNILNIPLPLADHTDHLIDVAMQEMPSVQKV